jgi:hypothetical protein
MSYKFDHHQTLGRMLLLNYRITDIVEDLSVEVMSKSETALKQALTLLCATPYICSSTALLPCIQNFNSLTED